MTEILTKPNKRVTDSIDALVISDRGVVCPKIQKIIDIENFSWQNADIGSLAQIKLNPETIAAAIIDAESVTKQHQEKLLEIIELLDKANIPTVLYGNSDNIDTDKFKTLNVIEKTSARQIIPVIKISNVYRKRAIAIKNNNLDISTKDNHTQQLENQLKMAGAVQRDFLPQSLPNSDKIKWSVAFMPADWVSGDIYDVARLDEQNTGFYLADAVGHSMPAALLTMFLKQSIQMRQTLGNEYKIFSPLEVIENLHQKMFAQHLSGCQFATCCYCLLNTQTLNLSYCRAGHPYPILIRKNNPPQQLQTTGSLLGVFDNAHFEQASIQLEPGDKLLLYSDGAEPFIGSVENDRPFEFTSQFLNIANLPASQLASEFESVVRQNKASAELDDTTLIVLEIL
ncbi:MAG: serine/threonine-protein phosphatase [Planctomycetes bacterium]|nr:serine/threonine-protein phosphatase [Planctomycetota bacterium]MBU1517528.1 serine/threonine-protein phosphatase [Planctomycetota bacterium]MBU2597270.1 serine/threonine-protein phosphatase [Planctomycetota bacterium]